jgi:hypothetical protein
MNISARDGRRARGWPPPVGQEWSSPRRASQKWVWQSMMRSGAAAVSSRAQPRVTLLETAAVSGCGALPEL